MSATIWLTGLSGAGKTTIAEQLVARLRKSGEHAELLDGDELRESLSAGLGFSREDRDTHVTRVGFVADLLARNGTWAVVPVIAPHAEARAANRARHERSGATDVEVHVATSIEECERRDAKGLYAKARAGQIVGMTGIDDPYEIPEAPDLRLETEARTVDECVEEILDVVAKVAGSSPVSAPAAVDDAGSTGAPSTAATRRQTTREGATPTAPSTPPPATPQPSTPVDSTLRALEAEAIEIVREVVAEFERPALLFSGGKDSAVLLHVALKALAPAPLPITLLHVDTGHNLPEVIAFRDGVVARHGLRLHVAAVEDWIADGRLQERPDGTRNPLQTVPLVDTIEEQKFDALLGGARRDEDRARAKERIFSVRSAMGGWDPRGQRPELWNIYNGRHAPGENTRVFPLSNWTELDIWRYIAAEDVALPPIYFAHERDVFLRDGMWLTEGPWFGPRPDERVVRKKVRYRTVGDGSCTGAVESAATTTDEIIAEVAASHLSERGATRADDRLSEAAMEDRKREGYF